MVGHVACMEDMRNAYELLVSKTVGKQKVQIREFKETVCVIGLKWLTRDTSYQQL